jgi:hypothetical protein
MTGDAREAVDEIKRDAHATMLGWLNDDVARFHAERAAKRDAFLLAWQGLDADDREHFRALIRATPEPA